MKIFRLPTPSLLASAAFLLASTTPLAAQDLNTAATLFKVNRVEALWTVNADATSVYETTMEREALSVDGAQMTTKTATVHNKALQSYEVLEAYTLKSDGRRLPVDNDGIQIQNGVASGNTGASMPDAVVTQITFPNVQKGDRTVLHARLVTHTPELQGWAKLQEYLPALVAIDAFHARIVAPRALGLKVVASDLKLVKLADSDELQTWEADGSVKPVAIDNDPANFLSSSPHLLASTFASAEILADAYAQSSNLKLVVSKETEQLAQSIIGKASTPKEKAAAIHDWVRKNIRYVAVYLGAGGWVPHDIEWILKNRYGDCKDHAILMQALLQAVGIEAAPVLINATNEYASAELPVGFNHAIVYLPALDVFADPTDADTPFGNLPFQDADKPVVVALKTGGKLMRTPAFSAHDNHIKVKTVLNVDKSGKATGQLDIETKGLAAATLQARIQTIPEDMRAIAVQKLFEGTRRTGRGSMDFAPIQRDTQTQTLTITALEIDNLLADPSGGAINPQPTLPLPVYANRVIGNYSAPTRTLAVQCVPVHVREDFELRFDAAYEITRIPTDVSESDPDGISFASHYERDGNTVKGWRELTFSQARHVCSPEQYAARRTAMLRVTQGLRGAVMYQQLHY